jgi:transcriptional antiterminator RfaH
VTGMAEHSKYMVDKDYKWYAIYTRLNHKKSVEASLKDQKIEVFLPKKKILRTWSDRKKWIEVPVLRPYVFVHVSKCEYYKVLQIPSVLYYIYFNGVAASIPEKQIEAFRLTIENNFQYEMSTEKFKAGEKVEIINGPLTGLEAEKIRNAERNRLLLRLNNISYSLKVDIPEEYIKQSLFCRKE